MQSFPPTIVLRHRRENLNKCSLRGLETRPDFRFYRYPNQSLPSLDGYILLVMDGAPPLTRADAGNGLFILDATWRYAGKMKQSINPSSGLIERTLPPHFLTAYPRRQEDCPDPERGLASIEAIFIAYAAVGRSAEWLLDSYHWREQFLQLNRSAFLHLGFDF